MDFTAVTKFDYIRNKDVSHINPDLYIYIYFYYLNQVSIVGSLVTIT